MDQSGTSEASLAPSPFSASTTNHDADAACEGDRPSHDRSSHASVSQHGLDVAPSGGDDEMPAVGPPPPLPEDPMLQPTGFAFSTLRQIKRQETMRRTMVASLRAQGKQSEAEALTKMPLDIKPRWGLAIKPPSRATTPNLGTRPSQQGTALEPGASTAGGFDLASLLPGPHFAPSSRFPTSPPLAASPSPVPSAPLETADEAATGRDGTAAEVEDSGTDAELEEAEGEAQEEFPGSTSSLPDDARPGLMATYKFQEVTTDGGVALTFEMPKTLDGSGDGLSISLETGLAAIHDALEVEQQQMADELAAEEPRPEEQQDLARTIRVELDGGRLKPINIVILVVGTRGDVQPFIGIALRLKEYGHRVRLASHKIYRDFVEGFGLEFYPLGGDPKVLSEFVVKHRGIMPGFAIGDALQQREQVRMIMFSVHGACTERDPDRPEAAPFRADAIVANPPSYGHIHVAEALNVPLHMVFTMPWTPTKVFPQPFARVKTVLGEAASKAREVMNWLSYFAVEDLAWLGMAGMVRQLRLKVLGLTTWDKKHTSHAIYYSKVPMTYIWSPSLVPRARDWPAHIEVVGFVNVELKKLQKYTPPADLQAFLDEGEPPVYIGFGSLVVDEPEKLTRQFLEALHRTGLRAIIQRGWGGLGAGVTKVPEGVMFIDSAPHDWLFERVRAVVHHGGAGTTATGLYLGKPTFIVPFFGDQPFWGAAVHGAGAGPPPVPIDSLTTDRIVDALKELILPTRLKAAQQLAERMRREDGAAGAVVHIHSTVYGALNGTKRPVWMRDREDNSSSTPNLPGCSKGGSRQASTAIKRVVNEDGDAGLAGFWRLPHKIANIFSRARTGPMSRHVSQAGSSVVAKENGKSAVQSASSASLLAAPGFGSGPSSSSRSVLPPISGISLPSTVGTGSGPSTPLNGSKLLTPLPMVGGGFDGRTDVSGSPGSLPPLNEGSKQQLLASPVPGTAAAAAQLAGAPAALPGLRPAIAALSSLPSPNGAPTSSLPPLVAEAKAASAGAPTKPALAPLPAAPVVDTLPRKKGLFSFFGC